MNNFFRRNSVTTGLLSLGIVGIFIFGVFPLMSSVSIASQSLAQERVKAAVAKDQEQNARATKLEYTQLQERANTFQDFFISEEHLIDFIGAMENAALHAGVQQDIQTLNPPLTEKQSPMQVTAHGTYPQLLQYLTNLQTLPYAVTIDQASFTQGDASTDLNIQATTYWK